MVENHVGSGLEYSVLGPVEAARDGVPVPIPGAKQRTLLAALLLEANRVVSAEWLIARLWEQDPPAQARNALQNHIKRLRQVLIGGSGPGSVPDPITTRPDGYLMAVPEQALDLSRFTALVRRAESAAADGRPVDAAALYGEALAQWRGEPLRETSSAALRGEYAGALTERRLATIEARIELELQLGRHERVLAELAELTAALPLREKFWSQRLLALYRSGRQAEALNAYQAAAAVLADELGVDPGAALREMHQAILTDALAVQAPPRVPDAREARGAAAGPRRLPPAPGSSAGAPNSRTRTIRQRPGRPRCGHR
jgi:DNA-binding SARP family transcriptional activator